jgi:hypothetical protein
MAGLTASNAAAASIKSFNHIMSFTWLDGGRCGMLRACGPAKERPFASVSLPVPDGRLPFVKGLNAGMLS